MTDCEGVLEELLARPAVTDIVIGIDGAWTDEGKGFTRVSRWRFTESEHRGLAVALIERGGRHLDVATPFADVRLGNGVRVHAIVPPASVRGTAISIRVPRTSRPTLEELEGTGMVTPEQRSQLEERTRAGRSFLIAGATGSGKTTLAAAMLATLPDHLRIVTVEDVAELRIAHPHVVSLQTRQANIEGAGVIDLGDLVRQSLRMRPDWLVVGEMRGAEIRDVLLAHNSGHHGGSTVHARSLSSVVTRLEALGALAGLSESQVAQHAVDAFDDIYFVETRGDGRRLAQHGTLAVGAHGRLRIT